MRLLLSLPILTLITTAFGAFHAGAQSVDLYSAEYIAGAGDAAVLFSGRTQSPMPGNVESRYLRDRGDVYRDNWGSEAIAEQVSAAESYSTGKLIYDGIPYSKVRMRLDLYRDQLVVLPPDGSTPAAVTVSPQATGTAGYYEIGATGKAPAVVQGDGGSGYGIVLSPEYFGHADLRGYRIVYMQSGVPGLNDRSGYYLLLHDGRHDVLKKEGYVFHEPTRQFTGRSVRYYVEADGIYHRVKSKGSLLGLFKDRKKELKRYIRDNDLDMRRDSERAVALIVTQYELLTR